MEQFWRVVIFLCVLVLAYIVTRVLAITKSGFGKNKMQKIETLNLTNSSSVSLIKVCGKNILIGVTKENVTMLKEIEENGMLEEENCLGGVFENATGEQLEEETSEDYNSKVNDLKEEKGLTVLSFGEKFASNFKTILAEKVSK